MTLGMINIISPKKYWRLYARHDNKDSAALAYEKYLDVYGEQCVSGQYFFLFKSHCLNSSFWAK